MVDSASWLVSLEAALPLAMSSVVVPAMLLVLWHHDVPGAKTLIAGHAMLLCKRLLAPAIPLDSVGAHAGLVAWELVAYGFFLFSLWVMDRGFTRWRLQSQAKARAEADAAVARTNEVLIAATRTMRETLGSGVPHVSAR